MRCISRLLIENFQSHSRSEFHFGPGLNAITGPSDQGKSAVLRALRWALYNEPRGSEFVRTGARECRVTVELNDGAKILRELLLTKTGAPSRNRYVVHLPGGAEPLLFEGFGSEVPAEVLRAHGMPQVMLDTDRRVMLSFGTQLEGPFLLTETGSMRARAIGRLLGVHVVDAAMRDTQKDLRAVRAEASRLEREADRLDQELLPFANIGQQEARLEEAGRLLERATASASLAARLEGVREILVRTEGEAIRTEAALGALQGVERAAGLVGQAEAVHAQGAALERLGAELARVEQEAREGRARLGALNALPAAEQGARQAQERQMRLVSLINVQAELQWRERDRMEVQRGAQRLSAVARAGELTERASVVAVRLARLEAQAVQLAELDVRVEKGQGLRQENENALNTLLADYEQALQRLGRCPTCLQPIKPEAIARIMQELAGGPPSGHQH